MTTASSQTFAQYVTAGIASIGTAAATCAAVGDAATDSLPYLTQITDTVTVLTGLKATGGNTSPLSADATQFNQYATPGLAAIATASTAAAALGDIAADQLPFLTQINALVVMIQKVLAGTE